MGGGPSRILYGAPAESYEGSTRIPKRMPCNNRIPLIVPLRLLWCAFCDLAGFINRGRDKNFEQSFVVTVITGIFLRVSNSC